MQIIETYKKKIKIRNVLSFECVCVCVCVNGCINIFCDADTVSRGAEWSIYVFV